MPDNNRPDPGRPEPTPFADPGQTRDAPPLGDDPGLSTEGEADLRGSEQFKRALSDASFEALYLSEHGRCFDQNYMARKTFGYTNAEIRGLPILHLVSPEDRDLVARNIAAGFAEAYEITAMHRDGSSIPVEIQGRTVDYQGRSIRLSAVRDITVRKEAQKARAASERRNRALIEAMPDMMLVVSKDGVLSDYKAAADIEAYAPPETFLGKTLHEIMPREVADLGAATIAKVIASGQAADIEYSLTSEGEELFFEARAAVCGDDQILFVIRNTTETRRLREAETRSQRLETAGRIAGQVAHDFNNLLGPLMAYPEMIAENLPADSEAHELLASLEDAARQMSEINQQLLALGRRGHYNQELLDLNAIVANAVQGLPARPEAVSLKLDLADDLMPIRGGGAQIGRAVANLLRNALDALDGSGTIRIATANHYVDDTTTSFERIDRGEYAMLTIADTGGGIAPEILDRIFDPFFTTKTMSKQRGSGLGLSVVDGVVRDHGGAIDLETHPGHGTKFLLFFPITRGTVESEPEVSIVGHGESVLVIDDDAVQRDVNVRILERLGYRATAVTGGEEALAHLAAHPQDLLVLDMVMPGGMDGAETYQRIVEATPGQKAIIVSGYSELARVEVAQSLGAGNFVKKPLTTQALGRAVRLELDRKTGAEPDA